MSTKIPQLVDISVPTQDPFLCYPAQNSRFLRYWTPKLMCVLCFNDIVFVKKFCSISTILQCSYPQPMTSYWYEKNLWIFVKGYVGTFLFAVFYLFYFFTLSVQDTAGASAKGAPSTARVWRSRGLHINIKPTMLHGAAQVSPPALGHLEVCFSATRPALIQPFVKPSRVIRSTWLPES